MVNTNNLVRSHLIFLLDGEPMNMFERGVFESVGESYKNEFNALSFELENAPDKPALTIELPVEQTNPDTPSLNVLAPLSGIIDGLFVVYNINGGTSMFEGVKQDYIILSIQRK